MSIKKLLSAGYTLVRVSKVVADHNDLLFNTLKVYINEKIASQYFLIPTTSNYLWSSAVFKNQSFKVDCFDLSLFLAPKLRSVVQNTIDRMSGSAQPSFRLISGRLRTL